MTLESEADVLEHIETCRKLWLTPDFIVRTGSQADNLVRRLLRVRRESKAEPSRHKTPVAKRGYADKAMEARDKWIYGRVFKMVAYKAIVLELAKMADTEKWDPLSSIQGVRLAAKRYAEKRGLPSPPARHE